MPTATRMKRLLIDTLAAKTFEMVLGLMALLLPQTMVGQEDLLKQLHIQ